MAIVNYVKESIAFMEYACDNGLSGNERLLWYALFHIMNMRAQGTNWPDGFISISNKRLLSFLPYSEDSLTDARNRLVQHGVIKYVKGKKNEKTPAYALTYFSTASNFYPQIAGKTYGNMGGNMGGNDYGNMGGNTGGNVGGKEYDFLRKLNVGVNEHNVNLDDVDDDDVVFMRATRDAREAVISAFRSTFGRSATAAEADRLANVAVNLGITQFIGRAVQVAALNGANNPLAYTITVLREWSYEGLETSEELDEYQYLRDCADGRTYGDADDARKKLSDAREARRARKYNRTEDD